jgi:hypothetical protein
MPIKTVSRLAFKATASDIEHLEQIASTLRHSGYPFVTRTDAFRACLAVAAADPTGVLSACRK